MKALRSSHFATLATLNCAVALFASSAAPTFVAGCSSSDSGGAAGGPEASPLPQGVSCTSVIEAEESSLLDALTSAQAGDCVVLTSPSYYGTFVVPAGVTLVAAKGVEAELLGADGAAAVELMDGAELRDVAVRSGSIGVLIRAASATLTNVTVTKASQAAFAASCSEACDIGMVNLTDVHLRESDLGLWISGARLTMVGGDITGNKGVGLTSGYGLVARDGAVIDLSATVIEDNGYGVVIEGEGSTRATLTDLDVRGNSERGIWVQHLDGTAEAPALKILGDATVIEGNALTGFGALESKGIIIVGGKIGGTLAKPTVTNLGTTADIGDGIGLFAGTGDVQIDNVTLEANARAQILVDGASKGIIIVGGKVLAKGNELAVVVQNTTEEVAVPEGYVSKPEQELEVSAPEIKTKQIVE